MYNNNNNIIQRVRKRVDNLSRMGGGAVSRPGKHFFFIFLSQTVQFLRHFLVQFGKCLLFNTFRGIMSTD